MAAQIDTARAGASDVLGTLVVHLRAAADHRHPRLHEDLPVHALDPLTRACRGGSPAPGVRRVALATWAAARARPAPQTDGAAHAPPAGAAAARRTARGAVLRADAATTAARRRWRRCWCTPACDVARRDWPTRCSCRRASGTLQVEMLAGARRHGALARAPAAAAGGAAARGAAGHPVVVLQNLGLRWSPALALRGARRLRPRARRGVAAQRHDRRETMRRRTFEHTWARAARYWAFVALPPGRLAGHGERSRPRCRRPSASSASAPPAPERCEALRRRRASAGSLRGLPAGQRSRMRWATRQAAVRRFERVARSTTHDVTLASARASR